MTWIVAITIVAGVFGLGFMVGVAWWRRRVPFKTRIAPPRDDVEVHEHATELVLKAVKEPDDEKLDLVRRVIAAYREALPIAGHWVAWREHGGDRR